MTMSNWAADAGISIPIIQAPIGNLCSPALVSSVCNAGALGMYSAAWRTPAELRDLIHETRRLTDRRFGINLTLAWPEAQHELLTVGMEEGIDVYSLWWGDMGPFMDRLEGSGALVMATVGTADEARAAEAIGVDLVVAQGQEAGGHVWGHTATMPLVAAVVDAVSIPVVAAGGIADARGIAAAFCLGASGVWMGTRFAATQESAAHERYKQAILGASEAGTVYGQIFHRGWANASHRTLRNRSVEMALASQGDEPLAEIIGYDSNQDPVYRYSEDEPLSGWSGKIDEMCLYAGQRCGLVHDLPRAGELVKRLWEGAQQEICVAQRRISGQSQ